MAHHVDASIIDRMQQEAAYLGLNVPKAAKDKAYHDRCVYKVANSVFNGTVDWSYMMYHAHVAMGRLESPFRPAKKSTTKKGGVKKMSNVQGPPRKSIRVVIGKKVSAGLMMKITSRSGMTKSVVWKSTRRKHNLAVGDYLASDALLRLQAKAHVMIMISKRKVQ